MHEESSPSLLMSQLIAADAPLLSPLSATDSLYGDSFNYNIFYPSPPSSTDSPSPAQRILKSRMSPDSSSDQERCLPTHQVFNFTQIGQTQRPPSPAQSSSGQSLSTFSTDDRPISRASSVASSGVLPSTTTKRGSAIPAVITKKPRSGERINVKDFVPPDVSGLSKREARLVKNRAAAFLSRQRKREEFELMEGRVADLEQENAKLLALTQNRNSSSHPKGDLTSEIEELRAQLAAAKDRERQLSAELASQNASSDSSVKVEVPDSAFSLASPSRTSSNVPSPYRTGTSLGLMVLLCALPSLLSLPVHSAAPPAFPDLLPITNLDYNTFLPNDYDWSRVIDTDERRFNTASAPPSIPATRKLHFTDVDVPALAGLGGLDVSFDAIPSANGKIRVRIHPPSSADSPPSSDSPSNSDMWSRYPTSDTFSPYSPSTSKHDPFLGIGAPNDYGMLSPISSSTHQFDQTSIPVEYGQLSDSTLDYETQFTSSEGTTSSTRRVRIALKSLPAAGGEGGEWEVQIC